MAMRGQQAVFAVHQNAVAAAFLDFRLPHDVFFADGFGLRFGQCAAGFLHGAGGDFALSDGGVKFVGFF